VDRVNVGPERYCLRWERIDWGRDTTEHHCAECGERVFYDPIRGEGAVRLVCTVCLVGDSPPVELDVHPLNDAMHCSACMTRAEAAGWSGTSDARLHSNWWGV
jgi:hypothetical protein